MKLRNPRGMNGWLRENKLYLPRLCALEGSVRKDSAFVKRIKQRRKNKKTQEGADRIRSFRYFYPKKGQFTLNGYKKKTPQGEELFVVRIKAELLLPDPFRLDR